MSYKDSACCSPMMHAPRGEHMGHFFGSIMENGDKHQDRERFYLNQLSYDMYFYRLCEIGMSVFEWKNLPDGIDQRMLEYWLFFNGFALFFYDPDLKYAKSTEFNAPDGFAVLPCTLSGQWDLYNLPRDRRAYSMNGEFQRDLTEENSVICFNTYLRNTMLLNTELFAYRLSEIDRTIDVNVVAQKTPKMIMCDKDTKLTFKNIAMQIEENRYTIATTDNIDLAQIKALDMSAPFVGNELRILRNQIWNDALTYYGIENMNADKKERLVSSEVLINTGAVEAQRFTRLQPRKDFCDQVNRIFGSGGMDILPKGDIDVDFKAGIYLNTGADSNDEMGEGVQPYE